jgi:multidrug efflux pump subunit AcrB
MKIRNLLAAALAAVMLSGTLVQPVMAATHHKHHAHHASHKKKHKKKHKKHHGHHKHHASKKKAA